MKRCFDSKLKLVTFLTFILLFCIFSYNFILNRNNDIDSINNNVNIYLTNNVGSTIEGLPGNGSEANPYRISSIDSFEAFFNSFKGGNSFEGLNIIFTADVDMESKEIYGASWTNIFQGTLDGHGYKISNLNVICNSTVKSSSFWGNLGVNGIIRNMNFDGGNITHQSYPDGAGLFNGIAGTFANSFVKLDLIIGQTATTKTYNMYGITTDLKETADVHNIIYYGDVKTSDSGTYKINKGALRAGSTSTNGSISNIYWNDSISTTDTISGNFTANSDTYSLTDDEFKSEELLEKINDYASSDSNLIKWYLNSDGLPEIVESPVNQTIWGMLGTGTVEDPFIVSDKSSFFTFINELNNLNNFEDKYIIQTDDIDLENDSFAGVTWSNYFNGTYDGKGHTISNINATSSKTSSGMFGNMGVKGVMKNLNLIDGKLTTSYSASAILFNGIRGKLENMSIKMNLVSTLSSNSNMRYAALTTEVYSTGSIINVVYNGEISNADGGSLGQYGIFDSDSNGGNIVKNIYGNSNLNTIKNSTSSHFTTYENINYISSEEYKSQDILDTLNDYVDSVGGLNKWELSNDEIPILSSTKSSEEKSVASLAIIKSFKIDSDCDLTTLTDQINWYLDETTNKYYLLISNMYDLDNLKVSYELSNSDYELEVLDSSNNSLGRLENGSTTGLLNNDLVKLKITKYENNQPVYEKDAKMYEINIIKSTLPSIHINLTDGEEGLNRIINDTEHEEYDSGNALIYDQNGNKLTPTISQMKGRGNSTWKGYPKKPFQIKFSQSISMLGMEKSSKWLLIASYQDGSFARNHLFYDLATELGLKYGVSYELADVYINNEYYGLYYVTSKVEVGSGRVDIDKSNYLLEVDNYEDTYQITTDIKNTKITIKNPDLDKKTSDEKIFIMNDVKTKIDNIESLIYNSDISLDEINKYIDVKSIAEMYILQDFTTNYDALGGSTYLYYEDGKFYMGPAWDMDYTLNVDKSWANLSSNYVLDSSHLKSLYGSTDSWYMRLMQRKDFSDLVDSIVVENLGNLEKLNSKVDTLSKKIKTSAEMNYIRWPYSDKLKNSWIHITWGEDDFDSAVSKLKANLTTRYNYYLSEYKNTILNEIKYSTKDKDGNTISGTLSNNDTIVLPKNVSSDASISLSGTTSSGKNIDLGDILLSDGKKTATVYVSQDSSSSSKGENRIAYTMTFNVAELTSISIKNSPNKIEYLNGDEFDKTGMIIEANYSDNTSEEITDYSIKKTSLELGMTYVTIEYNGMEVNQNINVIDDSLVKLEIINEPNKVNYYSNENFDKTGMIIKATYLSGKTKNIEDYTIKNNKLDVDTSYVTIEYNGMEVNQNITVNEISIIGIEIVNKPTKLSYDVGDTLDLFGIKVVKLLNNGTSKEITDYSYNTSKLTINDTEVVISYSGYSDKFNISVIDNNESIKSHILDKIVVKKNPSKTTYVDGEKFNKNGMVVEAVYSDDISEKITDYTISDSSLKLGTTYVTIKYKDKSVKVKVKVIRDEIYKIKVSSKPSKLSYFVGDEFNPNGLVINGVYRSGKEVTINDYNISTDKILSNTKYIIIKYNGLSTKLPITVKKVSVESIVIESTPSKTSYYVGEKLNLDGLKVVAIYNNGDRKEITDYSVSSDTLDLNNKTIAVTYKKVKTSFDINVSEASYTFKKDTTSIINTSITYSNNFVVDAPYELFVKLLINNEEIGSENYTLKEGSTIIELKDNYLDSLTNGEYTMTAVYSNGKEATTAFTINKESNNNSILKYIELGIFLLILITLFVANKLRKYSKD